MSSDHPYYRRRKIDPYHVVSNYSKGDFVRLLDVHPEPPPGVDSVSHARALYDARTAEWVRTVAANVPEAVNGPVDPAGALLDMRDDGDSRVPVIRCLALLAFLEYFPWDPHAKDVRTVVGNAIAYGAAGYCGSFGRASDIVDIGSNIPLYGDGIDVLSGEGNYDLDQMHLIQIAYRYYDDLFPQAQENLVRQLLASGRIHRPGDDLIYTSGGPPNDWSRAGHGFLPPLPSSPIQFPPDTGGNVRIGETENHILQIHTARYLANQLMYPRDHSPQHDNRRNGSDDTPSCTDLMLALLRNFLRDDFSEYNAKSYQTETRNALRNLCSYAYDDEVRLAARMVLDYISAHVAVSSCDLRRMVPFRRRNEKANSALLETGHMDVGLVEWQTGSDRAIEPFAVQTGQLRVYATGAAYPLPWDPDPTHHRKIPWIVLTDGPDGLLEGLGDYRMPPLIHDLFVNDKSRRFYQRLHRTKKADVESGQNADNMELYAGSPSYLITTGGSPSGPAVDPGKVADFKPEVLRTQLGVAVTTSFMPAGQGAGAWLQNYARDLIQFSSFEANGTLKNYGVAPDFACGAKLYLPPWCVAALQPDVSNPKFSFANRDGGPDAPGFFLAIFQQDGLATLEAYDTWLFPHSNFDVFKQRVLANNSGLSLQFYADTEYVTFHGHRIRFRIWDGLTDAGAEILNIAWSDEPLLANDRRGDASQSTGFLNGTILNSSEEAYIEIANPARGQTMVLDMRDQWHPKRTDENGVVEAAGQNQEVWVDFQWEGPEEGDFFRPFRTVAKAAQAVADGGVIKIVPGRSSDRTTISGQKKFRIEAAIGGVAFGVR